MRQVLVALLALLMAAPACGAVFSGGSSSGSRFGGPSALAPAYRTIVVLGDTQSHINGTDAIDAGGRYNDLDDQITWILDNRVSEGIDLVLHVGDMIDAGNNLPLSDGCDGDSTVTPVLTCAAEDGNGEAACDAIAGCGYAAHNGNCAPCTKVDDAAAEWVRLDAVLSRLDGLVPYIVTKGNHDNAGVSVATDRDVPGWDDLYDDTYWNGLEAGFSAWNYDHLAAEALDGGGVEGFSRAWTTEVGGVEVLVVAPAAASGDLIDSAARTWALARMSARPTVPAILLAHYIGPTAIPNEILDVSESAAPNLWWAAGGHTSGNSVEISTNGGESVLETVTDWTSASSNDTGATSQNDYMTLVRVYTEESPTELFVRDYSVGSGLFENGLGSGNRLDRQDFDIYPPASELWDLSAYSSEIASYLGTHTWPTLPTITSTQTLSTNNCSQLDTWAGTAGTHVTVSAAQTSCGSISVADDVWLEFTGSGGISGGTFDIPSTSQRVRISGGTHTINTWVTTEGDDITIDDGNWTRSTGPLFHKPVQGNLVQRLALVGNTMSAGSYCFLSINDTSAHIEDFTVAGNACSCATNTDEACFRIQGGTRSLVAANWIDNGFNSKQDVRFFSHNSDSLVIDNISATDNTSSSGATYWAVGTTSVGAVQQGDVTDIGFVNNRIFNPSDNVGGSYYTIYSQQANPGVYSCTGVDASGNVKLSTSAVPFKILRSNCTGTGAAGDQTVTDLDLSPYNGNTPTCSTDYGRDPLGCGHVEYTAPF